MSLSDQAFNTSKSFAIALDGPSASGKSHLANVIADKFQLNLVESGLCYRIFAHLCIHKNIFSDRKSFLRSNILDVNDDVFESNKNLIGLRDENISIYAAQIAQIPELRDKINKYLKYVSSRYPRIIIEGRDIAKVVLPHADLKIFLTADLHKRALRRQEQFLKQGIRLDFSNILSTLSHRDSVDMEREIDPLSRTDSSFIIDSTNLSIEDIMSKILSLIRGEI